MQTVTGPYAGVDWQLVGGDLALDLVNTVGYRPDPARAADHLPDLRHLADWLAVAAPGEVDLSPEDLQSEPGRDVLARVRSLREDAAAVLTAHVHAAPVPHDALDSVRQAYEEALRQAELSPGLPLRHLVRVRSGADVVTLLALAVGRLCSRDDLDRLRTCSDAACGWFFLDVSRNRSRRWCDPGLCGNRARVRTFAARQRSRT